MKISDIQIGAKVTYFDGGTRQAVDAVVTGVLDLGPNRYYETIYVKSIGSGQERALALRDYKKVWPSYHLSWCFSDNIRFKRHIIDGWAPKKPVKREPDPKYAKLDHGNNARAKEAMIAAQRPFVSKVMEQGFYWQREFVRGGGRVWVRRENPEFEFNHGQGGYSVRTPDGWVRGKKFGHTVVADEPPEGDPAAGKEGSQRREKEL